MLPRHTKLVVRATLVAGSLCCACSREQSSSAAAAGRPTRPSILLVTLDTTRADVLVPEVMPHLVRLAEGGTRFRHAYATVPMTLPSHASMLTGLYASEHGIHENSRPLAAGHRLVAQQLHEAGYATAAFVSSFVLDRQFGLARGFDRYDDELRDGALERGARETTERALAWLASAGDAPVFVWVHYYDPHAPYAPPEPYRGQFAKEPYRGEVAYVDSELGRLVEAFERRAGAGRWRLLVVGDHGEGLGEHGEAQHGNLLYQATVRVPLVLAGEGVP
ncbi:MAG TPA: sulfatase, partial [Thermoanaerobaculia bacterium]|nr:sulfatase [Thermoanaerobaculia bacterium]